MVLGAFFHTMTLLPGLRGWPWTWAMDLRHAGLQTVGVLLIPRALIVALAYFQIAWGYRLIGGLEPGGVVVLLPTLSAHAARGDREALRRDLGWTLGIAGALSALAGGALWFGGETLVRGLLARGAFGEASVEAVGAALRMFAPGLVTYTLAELTARAFYARHDFLRPLAAAVAGTAAYLAMAPALVPALGASGPALANSIAIGLEAFLLLLWMRWLDRTPNVSFLMEPGESPPTGEGRSR